MKVTLAFCKKAYETIIGEQLPSNLPYAEAARIARAKDPKQFSSLVDSEEHQRQLKLSTNII